MTRREYRVIINLYDGKGNIQFNYETLYRYVDAVRLLLRAEKLVRDFKKGKCWIEEREVSRWRKNSVECREELMDNV